jgi:RNA-binding protein YlmH
MEPKKYNTYLDGFSGDKQRIVYLTDKVRIAKKTWEETFTDFLNPDEQIFLKRVCRDEDCFVSFCGGKGNFERAIAGISNFESEFEFPVDVIKIQGNLKFQKLNHRDYLGSLLSLGIKREKIGDINVYEDGAEVWLQRDIADYICLNLTKIKNTGIKVDKIPFSNATEKIQEYKEFKVNVASMRLDGVISSVLNISRTSAASLIKAGAVKVNYMVTEESSKKINEGDLISARGYGRYIVEGIIGTTRSDRNILLIKQYT